MRNRLKPPYQDTWRWRPPSSPAALLDSIEEQLTQAAELQLIGAVTQALYVSTLRGALAVLPMPLAPEHIKVLVSKCETVMETV